MHRQSLDVLARAALQNLEAHRQRIDDLNVYPVPDGDTGTNLLLTMRGIVDALARSSAEDPPTLAHDVSRGALMSARGNSGVILSQIVRGFAEVIGQGEVTPTALGRAFRSASDAAYRAIKQPVEGTMLTVIREMADAAERRAGEGASSEDVIRAALSQGEQTLARTPEMLDVLRWAGVVDAGGAGLVEIVRGVALATAGDPLPEAPVETERLSFDAIHQELSRFRYCTTFVVEGDDLDAEGLEGRLEQLGDSLLVVGDSSALKVHVHTDDPGAALALGTAVGVIEEVEIANMHVQTGDRERRLLEDAVSAPPTLETGLVAVCQGAGVRALFEHERATVIEGGQSMNPSVDEIVAAIDATPASEVIVLPNNANVILAAEQAVAQSKKPARVVPSRSIQAGFAAIGQYVATTSPEENEQTMLAALASIATGEVTVASRDAELDGVTIRKGAYLGLVDGTAVASGDDLASVSLQVVDRVLDGERSWLGVLTGDGAPPLDALLGAIREAYPGVDVDPHEGGQPHYPLLLVAE